MKRKEKWNFKKVRERNMEKNEKDNKYFFKG